jgi:hypothetical protein
MLDANRAAIASVVASLTSQLQAASTERAALQKAHGIRVVSREQAERIAAEQQQALAAKQQAGGGAAEAAQA